MSAAGAAAAGAAIGTGGTILGSLVSAQANYKIAKLQNQWNREQAEIDRRRNYYFGELAAQGADKRTRQLYADIESPQALLNQYKKAGLSPSLMFGGTPGQGGMGGAQGSGASGPTTQMASMAPFAPPSVIEAAQAAALAAQTKKTEAETENIKQETTLKEIEKQMSQMTLRQFRTEWELTNSTWETKDGEKTSLFEAANDHYSYESFLNSIREDNNTDPIIKEATTKESGQKVLRQIYESASRFHRDIITLSQESVSANFQMNILKALQKEGFEDLNAQAAIAQLQQEIQTNELTQSQKEAWNNLIDRLGKKGSTTRDIMIVLGMIAGNFASHTGIKVNVGR